MADTKRKKLLKYVDWLVVIVAIFVVISFVYRATGGNIDPSRIQSRQTEVTYTLEVYGEEIDMLKHIRPGDQIAEAKRDFPLYVKSVDIVPYDEPMVIIDGVRANHISSIEGRALVTVSGTIDLKGKALSLGKQEISPGNRIFLESRLYKLSSRILRVEQNYD